MKLTLVRWGIVVNARGALGRALLRRYIAETSRLIEARERVASEWASYR